MQRLRDGLWRWTAPHPAWRPGADWPRDVGCVYYEGERATVLIDPLVPPRGDEERFWRALDADVERRDLPVHVVLTAPWHRRSTDSVVSRYGGRIVDARAVPHVTVLEVPPADEGQLALFLDEHRALVVAEVLSDNGRGLEVLPSPALRDASQLQAFLTRLFELPVELILLAHGPPVLDNAREALVRAVGA